MGRASLAENLEAVVFRDGSWESRAACRGAESAWFVPPMAGESKDQRRERESAARRICSDCPVRQECLDYALRVNEPFGIWGGLTEQERRQRVSTA
jgi:WhiB family transcriptional regulator, redox-sensing transcriptional regulator